MSYKLLKKHSFFPPQINVPSPVFSHLKQSTMYSAAQVQHRGVSFSFMPISNPRTSHSFCPQPLSYMVRPQQKLLLLSLLPIPSSSSNPKMLEQFTLLRHTKSLSTTFINKSYIGLLTVLWTHHSHCLQILFLWPSMLFCSIISLAFKFQLQCQTLWKTPPQT